MIALDMLYMAEPSLLYIDANFPSGGSIIMIYP